jgi:hypothetical protein
VWRVRGGIIWHKLLAAALPQFSSDDDCGRFINVFCLIAPSERTKPSLIRAARWYPAPNSGRRRTPSIFHRCNQILSKIEDLNKAYNAEF